MNLADGQFQHQTDGFFILAVFLNDLVEKSLSLLTILSSLDRCITRDTRVFFDYPQTDNFIAVIHQFVNKPFKSKLGVVVQVGATKECAAASAKLIAFVFIVESE